MSAPSAATGVPSDTYLALELLTEECSALRYASVVLKTQLYTLVPDPTTVEEELDQLRRDGRIRLFYLETDRHDVAILLDSEHSHDVASIARGRKPSESEVLLKFKEKVLDRLRESVVSKEVLAEWMGVAGDSERESNVVRVLQSLGFLLNHIRPNGDRARSYDLWSPRLGYFVTSLVEGRKEVIRKFKAKKFRELSQSRLFQSALRKSRLGIKYHVRDLMGLGILVAKSTPSGIFYKLVPAQS